MTPADALGQGAAMTMAQVDEAFPFHIALDGDLRILHTGRSTTLLYPDAQPGTSLRDCFDISDPGVALRYEEIVKCVHLLFVLKHRHCPVPLRGQMMPSVDGGLLFLASPWLTSADQIAELGLCFEDFAIHDPMIDMLQMQQLQRAVNRDLQVMTQRLKAQGASLREANATLAAQAGELRRLALVASRTDNGVVLSGPDGRVEWINEGFSRLTGYTLLEVAGKEPDRLLAGAEMAGEIAAKLAEHVSFATEVNNRRKDGTTYRAVLEVRTMDDGGGFAGHMAMLTDITERHSAAQKLQSESEFLNVTLGSIDSGIVGVDIGRRITLMNKTAEILTGWDAKDAHGHSIAEVFNARLEGGFPARDLISETLATLQRQGDIHSLDNKMILQSRDGAHRAIVASAAPMRGSDGNPIGVLLAFRDIAAELANERLKRDFVSSVSHELRTPLTSIIGFVKSILADPGMSPEVRTEFLEIVAKQSSRLKNLVDDILEISAVESGRLVLDLQQVDLEKLAKEALLDTEGEARERGHHVSVSSQRDLPAVHGDPSKLRSVLDNLLSNAIKFTPDGGRIDLELAAEQNSVVITVRDNGPGIPAEHLPKIFEKFYRVRGENTVAPGTGLGLAITRSIVEKHGGSIEVESSPAGSAFRLHLPAARTDRPEDGSAGDFAGAAT